MGVDLRIWLLGGFRVTVDGSPVADGSWRRKLYGPQHALALLEALAALEPPTAARPLLRSALSTCEDLDCTPRRHAVQAHLLILA